jgi:hypothetical protein
MEPVPERQDVPVVRVGLAGLPLHDARAVLARLEVKPLTARRRRKTARELNRSPSPSRRGGYDQLRCSLKNAIVRPQASSAACLS